MVHPNTTFVRGRVVVRRSTGRDVIESVSVHVTDTVHAVAERSVRLVALDASGREGDEAARRTVVHVHPAFVGLAVVEARRADHEVVVAVPVHVTGGAYREAVPCRDLAALGPESRERDESARRTVVHPNVPFVRLATVPVGSADRDVVEPIPVHVAETGNGVAVAGERLVAIRTESRGLRETVGAPRVQPDVTFLLFAGAPGRRSDDQVIVAVTVHVSRGGHRAPVPSIDLVAVGGPDGTDRTVR